MKPSEALMNKLYQNIGKLFYALAAADNSVRKQETEQLKNIIRAEWLQLDDATDAFGTDSAYQIEIVFDFLLEKQPSSEESFSRFKGFFNEHKYLFTTPYKSMILKTATAIADSFHGTNEAENSMIKELRKLFN
jgi:hypothetical protein